MYVQVDIFSQLQNASEAFRTYIRDGLAQMEKNAAAGKTPSSVPLSTPPPASLTLPSSKVAPLLHVNTNSLNDTKSQNSRVEPTNVTLPSSLSEDERMGTVATRGPGFDHQQVLVDPTDERLPSGVVPTGTLDAIRERMKSIQLGAAGINRDSDSKPLPLNGSATHSQVNHEGEAHDIDAENPVQSGTHPVDEKALTGLQARMQRLKSGSFEHL
ncbi:hypothetical protein KSS87_017845 [Heliosperma pusillum]|nr:hypothetical protein KSS87_017845 [Heliosperma pusillum]